MKCPVLGLCLMAVCSAATQQNTALNTNPDTNLTLLPPLPDLSLQPLPLVPLFKAAVPKIVDPHALILAAARKHRVPAAFISSIVAAESNFDPGAISPKAPSG